MKELSPNYIVSITGYGWSGSTAVRDLLREYDQFNHFKPEYSFISDPHGFLDLEHALLSGWNFLKVNHAIQEFKKFTTQLAKKKSRLNHFGLGLNEYFQIDFENILEEFLEDISSFEYNLASRVNYNYLSSAEKLIFKLKRKFGNVVENRVFAAPSEEEFLAAVRKLHASLFREKLRVKNLILEKAIPVNNIQQSIRYFDNIKVLVIDRDPRDIFVDMKKNNGLFWGRGQGVTKEKVLQFVKWKETMTLKSRVKSLDDPNVLYLRFEDCVHEYEESKAKIERFLNLEASGHKLKKTIFIPEESKKNVGKWKQYADQDVMTWIAKGLPNELYRPSGS